MNWTVFFQPLLKNLKKIDLSYQLTDAEAKKLGHMVGTLDLQFANDLNDIPHYMVLAEGVYSFDKLLDTPLAIFPQIIISELTDEAKNDISDFGKALAFELGTAAGFHMMRSTESILKKYVRAYNGGKLPKKKDWGEYAKVLGVGGANKKNIGAIEYLRTRRNPLMHPEDSLTVLEADMLFGLCKSLIPLMIADIEKTKPSKDQNTELLKLLS